MKKEKYLFALNEIESMIGKIRSVNEAMSLNDDDYYYGDDNIENEESHDELTSDEQELSKMNVEKPSEEDGLQEMGNEVDQIREIALRGMIKLCHNTQDPAYDALKKIFQFCDKANEKKDEQPTR